MGERALLAEVVSIEEVLALHGALEASRPPGVVDLVPAARTVLVRVDPRVLTVAASRRWIARAAEGADAAAPRVAAEEVVELEAVYDGPDLASSADMLGLGVGELIARHAAAEWTVAFTGFAPGFGYLVSDQWGFHVPRREVPRTRVPAGAVGLAAGFTGAYPRETPGGWQLIATTPARLFDPAAAAPALLTPRTRVRFVPREAVSSRFARSTTGGATVGEATAGEATAGEAAAVARPGFRIVQPGLLATIQDLGRPGAAALGIAPSGALDRAALRTANRLVGNPEGAAALEVTMGGLVAVAESPLWFAVTGAWGRLSVDGREVDLYEAHEWPAGTELRVDWFEQGTRSYLAVRGGVDGPALLNSRATDLLAGLGPRPLRTGDVVRLRAEASSPVPAAAIAPWGAPHDDAFEVELAPGPRAEWFEPEALQLLYEAVWTVTNDADRVGVRLDGPELRRARDGELPSEGMVPGALQVPPSGRPTILLADGPVTGGYPVIAVATDASLDRIAQARPGTRIRFRHARVN